jgi:hypothetical protein
MIKVEKCAFGGTGEGEFEIKNAKLRILSPKPNFQGQGHKREKVGWQRKVAAMLKGCKVTNVEGGIGVLTVKSYYCFNPGRILTLFLPRSGKT